MPYALNHTQIHDYVDRPIRIVAIIVVAVVLRFLAHRAIGRVVRGTREGRLHRRLSTIGERAPQLVDTSPEAVDRRHQRAETVGAVMRSAANIVIFSVAIAEVLAELDVDLAPIIASAGIVGVAVGFGAQNLVRDFLSGIFLVLEDTYGVGDTVDLGPAVGTVENIGLRSTRIRDVQGTLWSIRNGEITRVANYSQVWQRALFDLLLPAGTDVARAKQVMLATAETLARDPENAGVVLDPPEVWGVNEVRPEGVIVRLAVRRRTRNDAFDRALRERLVAAMAAADLPIFMLPAPVRVVTGRQVGMQEE